MTTIFYYRIDYSGGRWLWRIWWSEPTRRATFLDRPEFEQSPVKKGTVGWTWFEDRARRRALREVKKFAYQYKAELKEIDENGRCREAPEDHRDSAADDKASAGIRTETSQGTGQGASQGTGGLLTLHVPSRDLAVAVNQEPTEEGIPVEQQDMPILAHRAAGLRFNGGDKPFASVSGIFTHGFGVDTEAMCLCRNYSRGRLLHKAVPSLKGDCGLYAHPVDMDPTYVGSALVNLQVELYGRVIVCEKGYRAQFQRVIECQLPSCVYCGRKADLVHVVDRQMHETTCTKHDWVFTQQPAGSTQVFTALGAKNVSYVRLDIDDLDLGVPITRLGR